MPGWCLSFFTLHIPLVGAHLKAGMKCHLSQPSRLQGAVAQGCGDSWAVPVLWQGHCPRAGAWHRPAPTFHPLALVLPWALPEMLIPPLGLSRTRFPHTTHPATYGNAAETEHFSPKDKNTKREGFSCCSSPSEQTLQRQQRMEVTLWSCLVLSPGSVLINVDEFHCKTK